MGTHLSIADALAQMEAKIAHHKARHEHHVEQEAFHAGQQALHAEQKGIQPRSVSATLRRWAGTGQIRLVRDGRSYCCGYRRFSLASHVWSLLKSAMET